MTKIHSTKYYSQIQYLIGLLIRLGTCCSLDSYCRSTSGHVSVQVLPETCPLYSPPVGLYTIKTFLFTKLFP